MRVVTISTLTVLSLVSSAFGQTKAVEVKIITPAVDTDGRVLFRSAIDGKQYPLVREAANSELVRHVQEVLASGIPQETLKLDRFVQNLSISRTVQSESKSDSQHKGPIYLLLSQEEGGFARYGFWLESADHKEHLTMARYVDLSIDEAAIEDGTLEEVFPHELAHVTLRRIFGDRFNGPSVKMHQSMSVTDYQTAFDEGYAEHLQPLVRDTTKNKYLKSLTQGTTQTDLDLMWLSRIDQQLRTDGVKENLFVHRKAIPVSVLDHAEPYEVFVDGETSPDFLHDELKSGQEMMASEGVVATLFYRFVNDDRLRNTYRDPAFYAQFFAGERPAEIRAAITPYENVNLKLFAAMGRIAQNTSLNESLAAAIVIQYAKLFPDEAESIYDIFLRTTYGATVSQGASIAFETALQAGRRGDIETFRTSSRAAFSTLSKSKADVVKGLAHLDGNIGPEIWMRNDEFKIAAAYWEKDRAQSFTMNLNTATEAELGTIEGLDLLVARRIVAERRKRGYFESLNDVRHIECVSPVLLERLQEMATAVLNASSRPNP